MLGCACAIIISSFLDFYMAHFFAMRLKSWHRTIMEHYTIAVGYSEGVS